MWKRTPSRACSFIRPPRSTTLTDPITREPAGIATRPSARTSRVTRASTRSSTRAVSLDSEVSIRRPITESAGTVTSGELRLRRGRRRQLFHRFDAFGARGILPPPCGWGMSPEPGSAGVLSTGAPARVLASRALRRRLCRRGSWNPGCGGEVREATGADSRRARGAGRAGAAGWLGAGADASAAGGAVSVASAPCRPRPLRSTPLPSAAAAGAAGALTSSVTIGGTDGREAKNAPAPAAPTSASKPSSATATLLLNIGNSLPGRVVSKGRT